jgi:hypothetical protein
LVTIVTRSIAVCDVMGAETKQRFTLVVSPVGYARTAFLSKPDTHGDYSDGKFKVELVPADADAVTVESKFQEAAKALLRPNGRNQPRFPIRTMKDGDIAFLFKSKVRPEVVDAYLNPVGPDIQIAPGSIVRVAGVLAPYEKGTLRGITAYMDAVQVIQLKPPHTIAKTVFSLVKGGFNVMEHGRG